MSDTPIYDQLLEETYPLLVVPAIPMDAVERFREQMKSVGAAMAGRVMPDGFRLEAISLVQHPLHPSWTIEETP